MGCAQTRDWPLLIVDGWIAVDTETTGLDPWAGGCRPFAFSFANADGDTAYIRIPVDAHTREVLPTQEILDGMAAVLEDPAITKVFHNAPFDVRMFLMLGIEVKGPIVDTLIGMHVINPDELSYGLKPISKKYLEIGDDDQKALVDSVNKIRNDVRQARKRIANGEPREGDKDLALYAIAEEDGPMGKNAKYGDYWLGLQKDCEKYARLDAYRTASLWESIKSELNTDKENGGRLWEVFDMEMELLPNLAKMENRGIAFDKEHCLDLRKMYADMALKAMVELGKLGLADLNPKSPKQMCEYFFGTKDYKPTEFSVNDAGDPTPCVHCAAPILDPSGAPVRRETTTKTGKTVNRVQKRSPGCKICNWTGQNPQCTARYLCKLAFNHDVCTDKSVVADKVAYWILRYDGAKHMLVNFMDQYLNYVADDPYAGKGHYCLHPNYKQCGPVTGRLSCERPNLMQVASEVTPRKQNDVPYRARECFRARPGYYLYMPDYSQIEVWIFASLAKDQTMLDVLMTGKDFHGSIASTVWGDLFDLDIALKAKNIPSDELTADQKRHLENYTMYRKRSKMLMFGKLYGAGVDQIAELMGTTVVEAKKFLTDYDKRLPGIPKFMRDSIREAREKGFVTNPFGRRYLIPSSHAYKATNYKIQGSAASIMKRAINRISSLSYSRKYAGKMFPLLNIHDEIVIEIHKSIHGKETMQDIIVAMQGEDHIPLGCPRKLGVGIKYTTGRWTDVVEVKDK